MLPLASFFAWFSRYRPNRIQLRGAVIALAVMDFLMVAMLYIHLQSKWGKQYQSTSEEMAAIAPSAVMPAADSVAQPHIRGLKLLNTETLTAGQGAKSIISDEASRYFYCMNLEEMSVTEYERESRQLVRTLQFVKTPGKGYDYEKHKWYRSFKEKPVEAALSHKGRYLWVSLHNAGGVVVWDLLEKSVKEGPAFKKAWVRLADGSREIAALRFFETGKTPKFLAKTPDDRHMVVSNWHDNSVSVIDISAPEPDRWKVVEQLQTSSVPRGMAFSADGQVLYVANMGNGNISQVDMNWQVLEENFFIGYTPRHLLTQGRYLYASLSSPEKIIKYNLESRTRVAEIKTADDPRTIAFSGDSSIIFATCYNGQALQAFTAHDLRPLGTWSSKGKPVGVSCYQKGDYVEAWVCHYTGGFIKIFSFQIEYTQPHDTHNLTLPDHPLAFDP